jgi:hypothetical protein
MVCHLSGMINWRSIYYLKYKDMERMAIELETERIRYWLMCSGEVKDGKVVNVGLFVRSVDKRKLI